MRPWRQARTASAMLVLFDQGSVIVVDLPAIGSDHLVEIRN
jgi:hypothetical protein